MVFKHVLISAPNMGALVELTRRTVGFMVLGVQGKARWDNTNRQTQRVGRVERSPPCFRPSIVTLYPITS